MHLYCRATVFCSHTCKKHPEFFCPFLKPNNSGGYVFNTGILVTHGKDFFGLHNNQLSYQQILPHKLFVFTAVCFSNNPLRPLQNSRIFHYTQTHVSSLGDF